MRAPDNRQNGQRKNNRIISKPTDETLPEGLDESGEHKAAGDELNDRAEENADKTTPACTEGSGEGFVGYLAIKCGSYQFKEDGSDQRAENDAYGAEEKSDEDTDCTPPHSPFCAAELLGSPSRNNIIQHRDDDCDDAPDKEELPREVDAVSELGDPQARIGYRRARKSGHYTTDDAYEHKNKCYDKKHCIHV